MRHRDEPKLDDLKKLLRRLENIEVDSGRGHSAAAAHTSTPQPGGYVGALRGAPVPAAEEAQDDRRRAEELGAFPFISDTPARPANKPASGGMASIVIGAMTAAIVSSLAAVAFLLWTGGQGAKLGSEARTPANTIKLPALVAPMSPSQTGPAPMYTPSAEPNSILDAGGSNGVPGGGSTEPADPAPQSSDMAATLDVDALERRADLLIQGGNLVEARQLLERAAALGSGAAALRLGATYDPARMAEFGRLGARADPVLARAWYERARALGAIEATARITELAKK